MTQTVYELEDDSRAKIMMKQMDIASNERIALWKLEAESGKLNAELIHKSQMEDKRMMVELEKQREQSRRDFMKSNTLVPTGYIS